MMKDAKPIVLIGAGAFGRFTKEICEANGREVRGFLDDFKDKDTLADGAPVIGSCSLIEDNQFLAEFDMLITLADFSLRRQLATKIRNNNGQFATAIHPSCTISQRTEIGTGVIINALTTVNSGAHIGDFTLVEDQCAVGVDSVIEDNVMITTGVLLSGSSVVKRDSFVGAGVVVIPYMTVGERCLIGAGAVVTTDIPDGKMAVGVPAKVIKDSGIKT